MVRATRRLLSANSGRGNSLLNGGVPKLLLPPISEWDRLTDTLMGSWMILTDKNARDSFSGALNSGLIKVDVLSKSQYGLAMPFFLFRNLQNPLWKDCDVDPADFDRAVGPSLLKFHDTLAQLRDETLVSETPDEKKTESEDRIERLRSKVNSYIRLRNENKENKTSLGVTPWRKQVQDDPTSKAAILSKMTTDSYFDHLFQESVAESINAVLAGFGRYVPGSCNVDQWALLSARAMYVRDEGTEKDQAGFQESQVLEKDLPVGAEMSVLYEVSLRYQSKEAAKGEITTTSLAVAVFESYLRGGPTNQLRWKVAMRRGPDEFPSYKGLLGKYH